MLSERFIQRNMDASRAHSLIFPLWTYSCTPLETYSGCDGGKDIITQREVVIYS